MNGGPRRFLIVPFLYWKKEQQRSDRDHQETKEEDSLIPLGSTPNNIETKHEQWKHN